MSPRESWRFATAFACGSIFALGLVLGDMTQPGVVIGFLDVFGDWDPRLAFVMGGALVVYGALRHMLLGRRRRPWLADRYHEPTSLQMIDGRLVGGGVLFGIGWGLSGFCPGPAIVSAAAGATEGLVFAAAMLLGMVGFRIATSHDRPLGDG